MCIRDSYVSFFSRKLSELKPSSHPWRSGVRIVSKADSLVCLCCSLRTMKLDCGLHLYCTFNVVINEEVKSQKKREKKRISFSSIHNHSVNNKLQCISVSSLLAKRNRWPWQDASYLFI